MQVWHCPGYDAALVENPTYARLEQRERHLPLARLLAGDDGRREGDGVWRHALRAHLAEERELDTHAHTTTTTT